MAEGGEWSVVRRRRESKGNNVTTFFISSIPENTTYNLWKSFQAFDRVTDAVIPKKKKAEGARFGFVRFAGVTNIDTMFLNLNTIKIGGESLKVVTAKFDRNNRRILHHEKANVIPEKPNRIPRTVPQGEQSLREAGKSYKEAVSRNNDQVKRVKEVFINGEGGLYPKYCIGRPIVGVAEDVKRLGGVRKMLDMAGRMEVVVSYIGGLSTLVIFRDKNEANEFIKSDEKINLANHAVNPDRVHGVVEETLREMVHGESTNHKLERNKSSNRSCRSGPARSGPNVRSNGPRDFFLQTKFLQQLLLGWVTKTLVRRIQEEGRDLGKEISTSGTIPNIQDHHTVPVCVANDVSFQSNAAAESDSSTEMEEEVRATIEAGEILSVQLSDNANLVHDEVARDLGNISSQ